MEFFQENKHIGNDFIPIRLYDILIDSDNRVFIETVAGLGKEIETEVCSFGTKIPHHHTYYELILVLDGAPTLQLDHHFLALLPGDLVLIGANELHNISGPCHHYVVNIEPQSLLQLKSKVDDIFPRSISGKRLSANTAYQEAYREILGHIHSIRELYESKPVGYNLRLIGSMFGLLGAIDGYAHSYRLSGSDTSAVTTTDRKRMTQIVDYISAHYMEPLTLEEVSKVVSLAPTYFCRFFKRTMGSTFFEYLNHYRASQAEVLLNTTDLSVTEISEATGFSSISYFDKVYKKIKGRSPSMERRQ